MHCAGKTTFLIVNKVKCRPATDRLDMEWIGSITQKKSSRRSSIQEVSMECPQTLTKKTSLNCRLKIWPYPTLQKHFTASTIYGKSLFARCAILSRCFAVIGKKEKPVTFVVSATKHTKRKLSVIRNRVIQYLTIISKQLMRCHSKACKGSRRFRSSGTCSNDGDSPLLSCMLFRRAH